MLNINVDITVNMEHPNETCDVNICISMRSASSGASSISFRKFKIFGKVGIFAWREGGVRKHVSPKLFFKWCNLVRFRGYFA